MPALDHRLIRLKALPDGFQTELIETAGRGQTGRGEDSVEHVEVFRVVDLDAYPPTPPTTPSTAKSPFHGSKLRIIRAQNRFGLADGT